MSEQEELMRQMLKNMNDFFFSQTAKDMSSKNDSTDEMLQKLKTKTDMVEGVTMMYPENEVSKQIHKIMESENILQGPICYVERSKNEIKKECTQI